MNLRLPLLVLVLFVPPLSLFAQNPPTPGTGTFTTLSGIEYANVRGHSLLADVRVPDGSGPWPVILYLHSGGWITGDRFGGPAIRQASRGYAVVSIDYELAPGAIWPAQIEDCKAAVRWIRANAARFHFDANRVGVFGTSAGGHLAAMLGTTTNDAGFEGIALGNAQFSSAVKVVVDYYGPTDLLNLDAQKIPGTPLDGNSAFLPPSLLMGCAIQQCAAKTADASPINHVSRDDPPFLIVQGMLDYLCPWQQSQSFYDKLRANGVTAKLVLVANAGHADKKFDELEYQQVVSDFLDTYLRGTTKVKRRAVR